MNKTNDTQNQSATSKPVSGDGTQQSAPKKDANWFGASQEPQEEFIESDLKGKDASPSTPSAPQKQSSGNLNSRSNP